MTTPTEQAAQPAATPAPAAQAAPTPPWGTDEQFDATRAWQLIQNQRADLAAKTARISELATYEQKVRDLEDAQKTEAQRLADQLAEAQKAAATSATEALRLRIALRHGISDEDAALFLTGTTEELMSQQAERLAARSAPAAGATPPAPAVTPRTPVEALRPGALPNPPTPTLADQIAAAEGAKNWQLAGQLKAQQLMALHRAQ